MSEKIQLFWRRIVIKDAPFFIARWFLKMRVR